MVILMAHHTLPLDPNWEAVVDAADGLEEVKIGAGYTIVHSGRLLAVGGLE